MQLAQARPATAFAIGFVVAVVARGLLVSIVLLMEPRCDLGSYVSAADGRQILAMANAWEGDLESARQTEFFKILRASRGSGSSHLIRFFMAPAVIAGGRALGLPTAAAASVPFWLFAAIAAGLTGAWLRDWRAGVLVAVAPPITLYATSFCDANGWLHAAGVACLIAARSERWTWAGVAGALACWARPEGAFLLAAGAVGTGFALVALSRFLLGAVLVAVASLAAVTARLGPLLLQIFHGPGEGGLRWPAFLDLPGRALLVGLTSPSTPAWKFPYVLAHLALLLGACWLLGRRAASPLRAQAERREAQMLLTWVALQLALILCLRGTQGFDDLPRYAGNCFPALVAAFLPLLPGRALMMAGISVASLAVATVPARKDTRAECPPASSGPPPAPQATATLGPR